VSALSRRRFLQLTGAAGAGLLVGGCGPQDGAAEAAAAAPQITRAGYEGPPVTLEFWSGFTGGDGPVFLELLDRFNREHENITVDMNIIRWREFYQVVPSAVATGSGPDFGVMHLDQVGTAAARGVITPLEDIADVLGLDETDFPENVWRAGVFQDRRYGIPLDVHPLGMYYNRGLLAEHGLDPENPPQRAEEYMEALAALKEAGIQGQWVSPFPFTGQLVFHSLLHQFGGRLYNEEGTRAVWDSDAGVAAMEWMVGLIEQGYSPPDIGQDAEETAFQNGQSAFNWTGIWQVMAYSELPELDWGVAPLPVIGEQAAVWGNSHNLVLMNQEADEGRRQAMATFIDWLSRESAAWAEAGQVPARNSVRQSEEFQQLEAQAAMGTQIEDVAFVPAIPGIGDAQVLLEEGVQEGILRLSTPAEALRTSAASATQILEANARRFDAQPPVQGRSQRS
jgi:multiple sugar transport system substrate-binding protein